MAAPRSLIPRTARHAFVQACPTAGSFAPASHNACATQARTRFRARPRVARRRAATPTAQADDSGGGAGGSPPPIDAPSGALLASASVLAVASVGCVFELTGGHPSLGREITTAILVVSFPTFAFLFYAAIRKGQQEALED